LNAKRCAMGQRPPLPRLCPTRCSTFATLAEEREAREDAVSKQTRLLRKELPALLGQLEQIPDPRDPRKRQHKLTVLLLWGLLMFVFQFASRRESNREMTRPQFLANLHLLFPEIETPATRRHPLSAAARHRPDPSRTGARRPGATPDPRQECPTLFDQPLPSDCHRWLAEARRRHPLGGGTPAAQRRQRRNPPDPVLRLCARGQPRLPQRSGHPVAQRVPRTRARRYRSAKAGLRIARLCALERPAQDAVSPPCRSCFCSTASTPTVR
jgi:hypothetical protein